PLAPPTPRPPVASPGRWGGCSAVPGRSPASSATDPGSTRAWSPVPSTPPRANRPTSSSSSSAAPPTAPAPATGQRPSPTCSTSPSAAPNTASTSSATTAPGQPAATSPSSPPHSPAPPPSIDNAPQHHPASRSRAPPPGRPVPASWPGALVPAVGVWDADRARRFRLPAALPPRRHPLLGSSLQPATTPTAVPVTAG